MTPTAPVMHRSALRDLLVLRDANAVRTLAQEGRLMMLALLAEQPHTATTLAHRLGMQPNRAHYHLKCLLRAGLIQPAGHGRKRWKEERFYVAIARHLLVDPGLTGSDPETAASVIRSIESSVLDWRRRTVLDIDPGQIARIVVEDSLRIRAGERVMVVFTPASLELAECILVELEATGAIPRMKPWSRNWILRTLDRHDADALAHLAFVHPEEDAGLSAVILVSQMMPQGSPPNAAQLAKLPLCVEAISRWQRSLRERGVRYLEIGLPWRGEFELGEVSPEEAIDSYWRCLITDCGELRERAKALIEAIGCDGLARIRTGEADELSVPLDIGRALVSDGILGEEDVRAGRTVENIPAGAITFLPLGDRAEGTFRAAYTFLAGRHFADVRVVIQKGRIASISARDEQELLRDRIAAAVGEPDRLAALSIGLNSAGAGPTGKASLDACLEGTITLSFGNNQLLGGDVRSAIDFQLPAIGASLSVGGRELVQSGRLIARARGASCAREEMAS